MVIVHRRKSVALYLPASLRKREQEEETHRGLTTHSGPSRENTLVTHEDGAVLAAGDDPAGLCRDALDAVGCPGSGTRSDPECASCAAADLSKEGFRRRSIIGASRRRGRKT
jgi:hypothetical protein